jgi:CDP-glycerol glycerophosphotransferase (TagB/SpsB family)
VKLHSATKERVPEGSARIVNWPPGIDIYDYLPDIDGLITDYSSIFYDFLALRSQPAVIYAFDLEDYLAKDHTLLYPFEDNVVGLWAHSFDELCDTISRGLRQPEPDARRADEIRRKFWGDDPGIASARIHNFVRARLANAPSLEPLVINRRSREQDIGR